MADVEIRDSRGSGAGAWILGFLVAIVLAVVLWFALGQRRGPERTDVNIKVDVPDAGTGRGSGSTDTR